MGSPMDWKHDSPMADISTPAQQLNALFGRPQQQQQVHQLAPITAKTPRRKQPLIPHSKLNPTYASRSSKQVASSYSSYRTYGSNITSAVETLVRSNPSVLKFKQAYQQPKNSKQFTPRRPGTGPLAHLFDVSPKIILKRKREADDHEREARRDLFHRGIPGDWPVRRQQTAAEFLSNPTSDSFLLTRHTIERAEQAQQAELIAARLASQEIVNLTITRFVATQRGLVDAANAVQRASGHIFLHGQKVPGHFRAAPSHVRDIARFGVASAGSAKRACIERVEKRSQRVDRAITPVVRFVQGFYVRLSLAKDDVLDAVIPLRRQEQYRALYRQNRGASASTFPPSIFHPSLFLHQDEQARSIVSSVVPTDETPPICIGYDHEGQELPPLPEWSDDEDEAPHSPSTLIQGPRQRTEASAASSPKSFKTSAASSHTQGEAIKRSPVPITPHPASFSSHRIDTPGSSGASLLSPVSRQLQMESDRYTSPARDNTTASIDNSHLSPPSRQMQSEMDKMTDDTPAKGWLGRTTFSSFMARLLTPSHVEPARSVPDQEQSPLAKSIDLEVVRQRSKQLWRQKKEVTAMDVDSDADSSEDELAGLVTQEPSGRAVTVESDLVDQVKTSALIMNEDQVPHAKINLDASPFLSKAPKPGKFLSSRPVAAQSRLSVGHNFAAQDEPILSNRRQSRRVQDKKDLAEKEARRLHEEAERKKQLAKMASVLVAPTRKMLTPISSQWFKELNKAMRQPTDAELAKDPKGTPLTRRTFGTCLPQPGVDDQSGWLNDEVITAYLDHVTAYGNGVGDDNPRCAQQKGEVPRYAAFNNAFWNKLNGSGPKSVARWSKRMGLEGQKLLQAEVVFVPINVAGTHWTIATIRPKARSVQYYDSMGVAPRNVYAKLRDFLEMQLGEGYDHNEWKYSMPNCPQQNNGSDCGVFAITTAKCIMLGLHPLSTYDHNDMVTQRQRILAELMNGGFTKDFLPEDPLAASYYN